MSPPPISFHALAVHVVSFFHLLDCGGLNAVFDPLHVALGLVELVKYLIQKLPQGLGLQDDRLNDWCDGLAEMMEVVLGWEVRVVFETVQDVRVRENRLFFNSFAHTIFD